MCRPRCSLQASPSSRRRVSSERRHSLRRRSAPALPLFSFFSNRAIFLESKFRPELCLSRTGLYAGPSQADFTNSTALNFEHTLYSFYGQDQWRARPNLTFTAGLRWDVDLMPSGADLKLQGAGHLTNYGNVQPRASVAWSLRGGKTVVRAGTGLFYGPFDYSDILVSWIGASEFTYMNQPLLPAFKNPSQSLVGTGASGAVGISGPFGASAAFSNFAHNGIYPSPVNPAAPLESVSARLRHEAISKCKRHAGQPGNRKSDRQGYFPDGRIPVCSRVASARLRQHQRHSRRHSLPAAFRPSLRRIRILDFR